MKHSTHNSLKVVEPCHENWNAMTLVDKGRHCVSCNKIVTDFSKMTDQELIAHLKSGGQGCGRFKNDQLNRALFSPIEPQKKNWNWLAAASLSAFISLPVFAAHPSHKAPRPAKTIQSSTGENLNAYPEFLEFTGVIVDDSSNVALDSAEIFVMANGQTIYTEADGSFYLKIKTTDYKSNRLIQIKKTGYEIQRYDLELLQIQPRIELKKMEEIIPEVEFVMYDSMQSDIVRDSAIHIVYTVGLYAPYYCGLHSSSTPKNPDFIARGLYAVLDFFGIKH